MQNNLQNKNFYKFKYKFNKNYKKYNKLKVIYQKITKNIIQKAYKKYKIILINLKINLLIIVRFQSKIFKTNLYN